MSRSRNIRFRLLLLGAVVAMGSLGLGAATLVARSASESHFEAAQAASRALRTHLEADDLHDVVRGDVYALVTARNDEAVQRLRERVASNAARLVSAAAATRDALEGRGELEQPAHAASQRLLAYAAVADEIAQFAGEDSLAAVSRLGDFLDAYDVAAKSSSELTAAIETWAEASRRAGEARILRANLAGLSLAFVLCLTTGTLTLGLTRQVRSSLQLLESQVDRVSQGDLRPSDHSTGDDELGRLVHRLSEMTVSLRNLVGRGAEAAMKLGESAGVIAAQSSSVVESAQAQSGLVRQADKSVREVVSQVATISESSSSLAESCEESAVAHQQLRASSIELAEQASALSGQAEQSLASIREVASAITQIAAAVSAFTKLADETGSSTQSVASAAQQVSTAAAEAAALAASVDQTALEGREHAQQAQQGIARVKHSHVETRKSVETLRERTDEIRGILDLMDDVAAETELLALNAAIISAQAGEGGRGFAVVADQIREMADRARENSGKIREIVEGVQRGMRSAAAQAEQGSVVIEGEVENYQKAAAALEAIGMKAKESSRRAREIAGAAAKQAELCKTMLHSATRMGDTAQEILRGIDAQGRETQSLLAQSEELGSIGLAVRRASDEQARGNQQLAEVNERVRAVSQEIDGALQEQRKATAGLARLLEEVAISSAKGEKVAGRLDEEVQVLQEQASVIKAAIKNFSV